MTERKKTGRLSISRRVDPGHVPAPWAPADLPASTAAPGGAVAKRDRTNSPPAPWVPAGDDRDKSLPAPWVPAEQLLASNAPAVAKRARKVAKLKQWVPPAEAQRNLPATVAGDGDGANGVEVYL